TDLLMPEFSENADEINIITEEGTVTYTREEGNVWERFWGPITAREIKWRSPDNELLTKEKMKQEIQKGKDNGYLIWQTKDEQDEVLALSTFPEPSPEFIGISDRTNLENTDEPLTVEEFLALDNELTREIDRILHDTDTLTMEGDSLNVVNEEGQITHTFDPPDSSGTEPDTIQPDPLDSGSIPALPDSASFNEHLARLNQLMRADQ
ncbi:MAG: hypothetical protein ABIH34_01540, partial [Nanoarchaeota archaeon]